MCTSIQVSGAGQRRECRNPGTKTCLSWLLTVASGSHPSYCFSKQLDAPELPPVGSFLSLACPRSTWWLSFQSYFLLRPLCTTFWMLWGQSHFGLFWSFCVVMGRGIQTRDHLGLSLRSFSQQNRGSLEVWLLVQRPVMRWSSPLSWLSRKSKLHASGCLLLAWIKCFCFFSLDWCDNMYTGLPVNLLFCVRITQSLLKCCRTFPRVTSEIWVWFSFDGNSLHVHCKVTD